MANSFEGSSGEVKPDEAVKMLEKLRNLGKKATVTTDGDGIKGEVVNEGKEDQKNKQG